MQLLIGVDDTDNLESRGTGHRVRQMAACLEEDGLGEVRCITRHQLLVDPRIPYTSHNSSACLWVEAESTQREALTEFCRSYLLRESAEGSDVGLCVAEWGQVRAEVCAFGERAKREVLTQEAVRQLAEAAQLWLQGLTGTGGGIIGALAAVGLRAGGNDGRVLWLRGLRELEGIYTAEQLQQTVLIESIQSVNGQPVLPQARVAVGDWPRPILRNGQITLLVEEHHESNDYDWHAAPKDYIKHISA